MSGFEERRFLQFVILAASFLVVPAFAQFEIAPDHFDGGNQQNAKQTASVKPKAKPAHHAAAGAVHPASRPASTTAATKRNESGSTHQKMVSQSKVNAELASSHR